MHVFGRGQSTTRQDLARAEFVESMDHFRQAATHAAGGLGATVGPKVGLGMDMARERMGTARGYVVSARGYVGPGTNKLAQAASRGWDTTIAFVMPLADAARAGSVRAAMLPESMKSQATRVHIVKPVMIKKPVASTDSSTGHMATAMVSIAAAGAALGATGALVARRRNRSKWAEYEPSALQDDAQAFVDQTRSAGRGGDNRPRTASKMTGWAKEHSRSAMDGVRSKMHDSSSTTAGSPMDEMTSHPGGTGDGMRDDMSSDTGGRMGDPMTSGAQPMPGKPGDTAERAGDAAHHMADKADAKLNDAAPRRGSKPSTKSGDASETADDSTRSSKNGRQQQ